MSLLWAYSKEEEVASWETDAGLKVLTYFVGLSPEGDVWGIIGPQPDKSILLLQDIPGFLNWEWA